MSEFYSINQNEPRILIVQALWFSRDLSVLFLVHDFTFSSSCPVRFSLPFQSQLSCSLLIFPGSIHFISLPHHWLLHIPNMRLMWIYYITFCFVLNTCDRSRGWSEPLRVCAALSDVGSLVLRNPSEQLTASCSSGFHGSYTLSWKPCVLYLLLHMLKKKKKTLHFYI